jgi:cyclopropane-fatty-acyl-phospholipid synthase
MSIKEGILARNAHRSLWLQPLVIACANLQIGKLSITTPEGDHLSFQGARSGPQATLMIHSPRFVRRLLSSGALGFAEGYMAGEWDSPDLAALLELAGHNEKYLQELFTGRWWMQALQRLRHWWHPNSRQGSRRNIAYHYDLGNDFYRAWLDEGMTYSCALFEDPEEPLVVAQRRKHQRILNLLNARPGERILEIGCGWGSFALEAARHGLHITGITLSREQLDYARRQVAVSGLEGQVELRLQDYREVRERFHHIVSIEMFEAVGEAYWPVFFQSVYRNLLPGGKAALQTITIDEGFYPIYRRGADFIQRYIFPGGMLPSIPVFEQHARNEGLRFVKRALLGSQYAMTLQRWSRRFEECSEIIRQMGFDAVFLRMWRYYLAYCRAGFQTGQLDLMQMLVERPGN